MRVIPTPIYIDFMNALGANAVPMPFTETYTALETGAVDGMTNPLINVTDMKFYEVTDYLTITNHMYNPQAVTDQQDHLGQAVRPTRRRSSRSRRPRRRAISAGDLAGGERRGARAS